MLQLLGPLDIIVLVMLLSAMIGAGIYIGRKKKSAEDYFMAGRSLKWWSVAGSIYGTNVSLAQIIGMLGIGYSIGFAQSHYEVLAIPAILLLCYVFIPVYRRRKVFTLSQFLEYRYNQYARLLYTILIIGVILILLVGGFYIGSRQLGLLFQGSRFQISYVQGLILIGLLTSVLVFYGGMESVVVAENIITTLMVITVIVVGTLTLMQPEIGGFAGLLRLDAQHPAAAQKMHLYLPPNHPDLPWTGVFSGLMVLHGFFWTTNQFEVQRILAAETNRQAKLGAIAAGFLKLTIPFFSIAAGVAAAYLFQYKYNLKNVQPDDAFIFLVGNVVPGGWGLIGLILAGFTGAIFSSIYSMLNSASTLLSMDVFKKYIRPQAPEGDVVRFGKFSVLVLCALSGVLALLTFSPTSGGNFFLSLSKNTSYLKPGIVSAFFLGVFWKRTHPVSAVAAIISAPFIGLLLEAVYPLVASHWPYLQQTFGNSLNFMHRVFLTFAVCVVLQILLSQYYLRKTGYQAAAIDVVPYVKQLVRYAGIFAAIQVVFLLLVFTNVLSPEAAALPAAVATFAVFLFRYRWQKQQPNAVKHSLYQSDLFWSGLLAGFTVWTLYYFA
jgi:SSS family solute:Na+ symporter